VLELDNTDSFTPTLDFHPSTKKYVDDQIVPVKASEAEVVTATDDTKFVTPLNAKTLFDIQVETRDISLATGVVPYTHGMGKIPRFIMVDG
jgi:hypothetical protein